MQRRACVRTISEAECAISRPLSEWRPISELKAGTKVEVHVSQRKWMDGLPLVKGRDVIRTRLIGSPISLFMLPVISHITMQEKKKGAQLVGVSHVPVNKQTQKRMERSVICQGCGIPSELDQVSEGHINKV